MSRDSYCTDAGQLSEKKFGSNHTMIGMNGKRRSLSRYSFKECLINAKLIANPVQKGFSGASGVRFWSEFW